MYTVQSKTVVNVVKALYGLILNHTILRAAYHVFMATRLVTLANKFPDYSYTGVTPLRSGRRPQLSPRSQGHEATMRGNKISARRFHSLHLGGHTPLEST